MILFGSMLFSYANESSSLKKPILNAKYVLEKSFTDSAAEELKKSTFGFFLAAFNKILAKSMLCFDSLPIIILDGYLLSKSALPSLKNSGEKIIFLV